MRFCLRAVPILTLLTSLASSPSETVAQPSDPAAVVKTFNDALNAGDGATALAQFADDAVVRTPGGSVFNGRDEIGPYAAGLIA